MLFCPLFSGSSGNAVYVSSGKTRILIDCGKSGIQVQEALGAIGVDPASLQAILITHEHHDHIHGAGILSRRYHLPIYATALTWAAMEKKLGAIEPENRRVFDAGSDFSVGDLGVEPVPLYHDAADPCGFRIWQGSASAAVVTDLGTFSRETASVLSGAQVVLMESNHDPDMVRMNPHYTQTLKNRILSRKGHLSNSECAEALVTLASQGTTQFILGHLSRENNLPELAMRVNEARLELEGLRLGVDVSLDMAWRDHVGNVYEIRDIRADHAVS